MSVARRTTDVRIHADVLDELRWDTRVNETEVGVEVDNGVVTLTGTVESLAKKQAAERAAHHVSGVLDVANDIRVVPPGSLQRTDTDIAQAVRRALEWDVFVPQERIQSTVTNGWVTLSGTVDRWAQRVDAYQAVVRLAGVRAVVNAIIVIPHEPVATETIRAVVQQILERRAQREAKHIQVKVENGEVTLSGWVRSSREREALGEAVSHTPGVREFRNLLQIPAEP